MSRSPSFSRPKDEGKPIRLYDLPREVLEALSILVGNSLDVDSQVNLVEIRRSTAIGRAERRLRSALRWTANANARTILKEALAPLAADFAGTTAEAEVLATAKTLAESPATPLDALVAAVERVLATPGCAADMAPRDRRQVWDKSREYVVQSCCHAWRDAGRAVTYSAEGPLVSFIQAVGTLLTVNATQLSCETIRKDIERFREMLTDPDGLLGEPEIGRR